MRLNFTIRTALWLRRRHFLRSLFLVLLCLVGAWDVPGFARAEAESGAKIDKARLEAAK